MAIKIQGDNMQYGDTAIATLSTDALTLQSGTSLNAQKLTASNGMEITNHMTAQNGAVNVSVQLTASNGLRVGSGGDLKVLGPSSFTGLLTVYGDMAIGQNGHSDEIAIYSTFNNDLVPTTNHASDLGTFAKQWGEAHVTHGYIDDITATGTSNLATVNVTGKLTASNGLAVTGDVSFDDANFSGDVTLGSAATDVTTVTGQLTASSGIKTNGSAWFMSQTWIGSPFMSSEHANQHKLSVYAAINTDLIPSADSSKDLGSLSRQWAEAHVDHGHIDDITSTGTSNLATVNVTGQLTASNGASITGDVLLGENDSIKAGVYITYSDATLKENIEVISNPIDKVMSMRGVTYNFKSNSDNPEVGFLAQEMKQAVPEVVYGNGDGNLGIDYAKLTSVLVEAIKTQQTQIQEQQSQIDELKDTLLKK